MSAQRLTESLNNELVDQRFLADIPKRRKRPAWIFRESLLTVGAWEPLFHRRRCGSTWVDDEAFYAYEHSEQFVKEILRIGGNLLITAFDKNYRIDDHEYPLKKQLAALCRKHGLRLATYIRDDQIYAEVFADVLKREDVLGARADGRVLTYGSQEWRKSVCFHKPETMAMMKASIRRAVCDLKVDAVFFDGFEVGGAETHDTCRCETCRRDFTEFLRVRYADNPDICRRRFGHTCFETIEPPGMFALPAMPTGRVTNPVWQEWISFRCTWTARFARIISEFIYELDPEVAIIANNAVQVKENLPLLMGNDLVALGESVDVLINESGYHPRITSEGCILQHAREYKMTHAVGCLGWTHVDTYGKDARQLRIEMGHAAAFNRGRVSELGHAFSCYGDFRRLFDVKKNFAAWLARYWRNYQGLEEVADFVVWRERKAMAFAEPLAFATAMRMEQLLIEDRLPFTVALDSLPLTTPVAVLPALACLDDKCCAQVIQFVRNGGGALIIGETSAHDGWGRRRSNYGLQAILPSGVRIPGLVFAQHIANVNVAVESGASETPENADFTYYRIGKGRVVYAPSIVDPASQPDQFNADHTVNFSLDVTNWRPPQNADAVRRALAWLAQNRRTMSVEAPRGVIANYYYQPGAGTYYAHVVNLTPDPVHNVVLGMEIPSQTRVRNVSVITPDGENWRRVEWRLSGQTLVAAIETLDVYAVIVVKILGK